MLIVALPQRVGSAGQALGAVGEQQLAHGARRDDLLVDASGAIESDNFGIGVVHAQVPQRANQSLFQVAQVAMRVTFPRAQIEDRVTDR